MNYLLLHNYRKIKKILIPNFLQIFFVLSIGILSILLMVMQFKPAIQSLSFEHYIPLFVGSSLLVTHVLTILLLKKNKEDLYFQQYVRKDPIIAFIFRWRREINMLLFFSFLLLAIYAIIYFLIEQYLFLLWTMVLLAVLFAVSLCFLVQVNMRNSMKKLTLICVYYLFVFSYIVLANNWLAFTFGICFVFFSIFTYKELDYIQPLYKARNIKQQRSHEIKDYPDFIFLYIIREKIYLELAFFSTIIAVASIILAIFGLNQLLLENIGLVSQLWTFLIIEMCALLGVGFSEIVKLHPYFFIKNNFNKYTFTCWYLIISFIISSFFVIFAGASLGYFMSLQILEFPFTFIEISGILLLSMYVSLFFPAARKKIPMLSIITITLLWMLTKNFILEKSNFMPIVIFLIFTALICFLFLAITVELSNMNRGGKIESEN